MATLGLSYVCLNDLWPGAVNPNLSTPTNGWDNTTDCCVTTPTYPAGTKIMGYNDETRNPGGYVMCYMQICDGTFAADHSAALGVKADMSVAGMIKAHYCGTCADGNENNQPWYIVTADCTSSDATRGIMRAAVSCSSATDAGTDATLVGTQWGWCWIGGVNPGQGGTSGTDLTWLYECSVTTTSGEISEGSPVFLVDDATNGLTFDGTGSAAEEYPCGWSIKADA